MRWNPFAAPPPPPENASLLGRMQELASRELVTTRALLTDFQEFIQQGNMLNMAVGLILGSSFSAILNSLVVDILSPIISLFTERGIANHYWPVRCPSTTPECSGDTWQTWKEALEFVFKLKVGVKKQCPYCKEFVKGAATRCKDCGSDISNHPSTGG
ncbi:Large Conductance Mechanosensitive Ion Channel (MscL) Family [Phytophthora nicotianae]|uniref:Large Conductance Mechanosensitive Ion Channel (MscL) Family n=1 Tax=Phytophthora nicotianae TaxID=4792 RepID=A0A0W8DUU5_PHYNI|nr:Large Conductance Mechanosensitive Ion Channel (MscL) Family [Phytophthora nicotianae]